MNYRNAREVLPERLLEEIQKYLEGEIIYIPRSDKKRAAWGALNGTRMAIDVRNSEIYNLYRNGTEIEAIGRIYSLSEDSIRKILLKRKHALLSDS